MSAVYLRASLNIHCSMGEIIERFLYWPCDSDFLNNKYIFLILCRWMTPPKAALICEENPQCGGFTYKVRETIKYYAADFLRQEQMGIPNSATCFSAKKSRKREVLYSPFRSIF